MLTTVALGFVMTFIWKTQKAYLGFSLWTLSNFTVAAGFLLLGLGDYAPHLLTIILGNSTALTRFFTKPKTKVATASSPTHEKPRIERRHWSNKFKIKLLFIWHLSCKTISARFFVMFRCTDLLYKSEISVRLHQSNLRTNRSKRMIKNISRNSVLIFAAFGLTACGATNTTTNVNAVKPNSNTAVVINSNTVMNSNMSNTMMNSNSTINKSVSSADTEFMNKAAQGGMAEVELGKLAASKGANADVKKFGQRMVDDHSKANTELKTVAASKSVTLPTEVNAEQKAMMDKLSKLSGAEFDKEYVKGMVEDHEKDVADFEKQSVGGTDADVKAFATKTLPTLKSHLEMIKGISAKMK